MVAQQGVWTFFPLSTEMSGRLSPSAKSWQVRTDSQTAGEVLAQHANQLKNQTWAFLPCQGPQPASHFIPPTKVVI